MRMSVIGTGYLGATHAACMALLGHDVLGVDLDRDRIAALERGEPPFFEPGLQDALRQGLEAGRLKFTSSIADAMEFADAHFIAVGTPQRSDGPGADLTALTRLVHEVAPLLTRSSVFFGKSTVPAGTAAQVGARLRELAPPGIEVEVAWNPEFLQEGHAVHDTLSPSRIVVGVEGGGRAEELAREIYAGAIAAGTPFLVTDLVTAELAKVAANSFLATKISFANAMADMCDAVGADVTRLVDALGLDSRIGPEFLGAGLGFGGGCLPKDIRALGARATELGADSVADLMHTVDTINTRRRGGAVDEVRRLCGHLPDARIAVLGTAFKPGSDDVRDSPALDVAVRLHRHGARVCVHDPRALETARRVAPVLDYAESIRAACSGADIVVVLTDWPEYRSLAPADLAPVVGRRVILDARNCLDPATWRAAGWTYRGTGRP